MKKKEINDFLKSRQGMAYLCMKYPNLTVVEAITEYRNIASK